MWEWPNTFHLDQLWCRHGHLIMDTGIWKSSQSLNATAHGCFTADWLLNLWDLFKLPFNWTLTIELPLLTATNLPDHWKFHRTNAFFFSLSVQNKMCYFLAVYKLWHIIGEFCAAITKDCTLVCFLFIPSSSFWKEIIHFHYLSNSIRNKFNRVKK